jgi:spore germination cell wall hydrolase CwlJ-like protein
MIPNSDLTALALTMIGEARGEGIEGMKDVGHTVMNRVEHPSWRGDTILVVCLHPWQYSCWNDNDPNKAYLDGLEETDELYQQAAGIAEDLIQGTLSDPTDGATYYYRIGSTEPAWAIGKTPCYSSGNHVFFKDIA